MKLLRTSLFPALLAPTTRNAAGAESMVDSGSFKLCRDGLADILNSTVSRIARTCGGPFSDSPDEDLQDPNMALVDAAIRGNTQRSAFLLSIWG